MRSSLLRLCLLVVLTTAGCTNIPERREQEPTSPLSNLPIQWKWVDPELAPQEAEADATTATETDEEEIRDLWDRLRRDFALSEHRDHPNVLARLDWYSNQTQYLDRVLGRAETYLHFVLEEVERRAMPTEIALLPIIESGYMPTALSPRKAAGLWQFIPSTGENFGLKQNWWYDGRRDVYASTHAALDYLKQLHNRFNGDWLLALAAYNSGEGSVERAIRKNQQAGKATDFWSLDLPRETREYVPKLLALGALIENPEKYGLNLKSIPNSPYLVAIDTGGQLDLSVAARLADMSLEELKQLNPGFTRMAMAPEGPYRLLLPVDKVEIFRQRLAELPPDQRVRWNRHLVQRGESLWQIARRYKTTPAVLRQINGLSSNTIRAGKYLLIPVTAATESAVAQAPAPQEDPKLVRTDRSHKTAQSKGRSTPEPQDTVLASRAKERTPALQKTRTSSGNRETNTAADHLQSIRYAVQPGDSLFKIAGRFNVAIADLRKWNNLKGDKLMPGQLLTIKVKAFHEAQNTY